MSRSTTLEELAGRCEAAIGPDRGLDWACHAVKLGKARPNRDELNDAPRYTASIDAAMTLVPEGYAYSVGNTNPSRRRCNAWVMPPPFNFGADIRTGATPALALCAAALRAQNKDEAHGE